MMCGFDRFHVCLGYYHYAVAYNGSRKANEVWARLNRIKYKPAFFEEYQSILSHDGYEIAMETYNRLCRGEV